ncbi:MAG: hypothetical protein Q4D06_04550 [Coriobacteriia bacterium]|nr:hypothetical protein [Coriobacteriia bacterium]
MSRGTCVRRIKDRGGYSLGELLVAMVIMGLVSMLLATGVSVSAKQYQQSLVGSESQSLCSTLTASLTSALRSADDFTLEGTTVKDGTEHYAYQRFWAADAYRTGVVALDAKGKEVASGKPGYLALKTTDGKYTPLVSQSTYTQGMLATAKLDWSNAGGGRYGATNPVCTVTLTVTDSAGKTATTTTFQVIPVNS